MPTLVQREAGLSLRAARDFVRLRVCWPADVPDGGPIVVFMAETGAGFEAGRRLAAAGGYVVLALHTEDLDLAMVALDWAADHGGSLGADPDDLLVAGGRLAATAALHARDSGWPPLSRQLLIGPDRLGWPAATLAGVAPATVVNAPGYADALRDAGVEVEELHAEDPMAFSWIAAQGGTRPTVIETQ